jgi:hypothetical protein
LRFDRAFGVIRPKREPRPGAELAGMAKCPASAFQENTDDDQGPEDYQKQGGLIGARQTARQIEPLPPPFSKRRSPNRPACVPFRFLRHPLTASESEKAPRRKANTARKSVHVVGSRPGMTVRVMHKRIWYKTGAGAGPVVPSHPLANLHRARCGYPQLTVNRRRTLTPPQLSHNELKQHRNLQFSENLTGVQF